ncbi:hypothetical protein GGTG_09323 [Gaeumannomyces tritici R3-111a-1]|uniref:Uncharacterized protein n=1 Tax=Gaeumannomyces tritici (strain R3-111a-1) TaxID=644352 RepID=J3P726_GAET3|nr:hypothetical protein GGTG_09323 [Gaeumannomyces tritici R3-111a-1]EJT72457.1 hypothetical protein GGTG_09323 [Gaeumannomyces tritici R3-111a-1]
MLTRKEENEERWKREKGLYSRGGGPCVSGSGTWPVRWAHNLRDNRDTAKAVPRRRTPVEELHETVPEAPSDTPEVTLPVTETIKTGATPPNSAAAMAEAMMVLLLAVLPRLAETTLEMMAATLMMILRNATTMTIMASVSLVISATNATHVTSVAIVRLEATANKPSILTYQPVHREIVSLSSER